MLYKAVCRIIDQLRMKGFQGRFVWCDGYVTAVHNMGEIDMEQYEVLHQIINSAKECDDDTADN